MSDTRLLLDDICIEYFNVTPRIAKRKAANGLLPVPAFRLSGTCKGPWYVLQSALDEHIARQVASAQPDDIRKRRDEAKAAPKIPKQTCLYRHFDSIGNLLYVGISTRVLDRIAQHRTASHWSEQIARIEIERLPDWESAYVAETIAIRSEKPMHNRAKVEK
jgi:predicted GIY-YIG superfamily endonuclease